MVTDFKWTGSVEPWKAIQEQVRARVVITPLAPLPRFIAGADCAFSRDGKQVRAAAVVFDRDERKIIETRYVVTPCHAPYVPTYLSFREIPAILQAIEKIHHPFNAVLVDGQGIAHPRRCGLASHLGVLLDMPVVGCAKTRLIGDYEEPHRAAGSYSQLLDKEEQIGIVLRTREGVRPLFISVGHRTDINSARELVLACCTRYRLPEPTRIADQLSKFR